jgi:hypothetical protein
MRCLLSVATIILLTAGWAGAGPILPDPDMELDSTSGGTPGVGTVFSFMANANGGGSVLLQNASGADWIAVMITAPFPTGAPFTCHQSNAFGFCDFFFTQNGSVINITYSGVGDIEGKEGLAIGPDPIDGDADFFHGIPTGTDFLIILDTPGTPNVGGWIANETFSAAATTSAAEPGSLWLLVAGAGFLLHRRKRL